MLRIIKFGVMLAMVAGVALMPTASADTYRVRATSNNTWNPDFRHILKGDRIVWKNPTSTPHNIKATSNNWNYRRDLPPGEKRARKFRKRGTYEYKCTLHAGMKGVIHVGRR